MKRIASAVAVALACGALVAPAAAQTIGQPIRLHDADQRVNVVTANTQSLKAVGGNAIASLPPNANIPNGGFVVTWMSLQDDNLPEIRARRFGSNGVPIDVNDISVNSFTTASQHDPAVAALDDGGFVVVWHGGGPGDATGVFFRRFDSSGLPIEAEEVLVNTVTSDRQQNPSVAVLDDGSFAITWTSKEQDGSGFGIYFRRYDRDGAPLDTTEVLVNTVTSGWQLSPVIAKLGDVGFVIAWDGPGPGDTSGVFSRRFGNDGGALDTTEVLVSADYWTLSHSQGSPTIAPLGNGGYVVGWSSASDYGGILYARRFAQDGTPIDPNSVPAPGFVSGGVLAIVGLGVSGFLTTWTERPYSGGYGIYAGRHSGSGSSLDGGGFTVDATQLDWQFTPSVTILSDGITGAIAWQGSGPGDGGGVFFQRFQLAGAPIARDDTATATQPGSPVVINVLANDADPDVGDTLTVTLASATHGSVAINGDGTLTYTPPAGCGVTSDTISYTIQDGSGNTATASVAVSLTPVAAMSVTPATNARLYGFVGGPFPPPFGNYLVSNTGCAPLSWAIGRDQTWLVRSPANGTLPAGQSTSVVLRASNPAAGLLAAGAHSALAKFRNLTNGAGNTNRSVLLNAVATFGSDGFDAAPVLTDASGVSWSSNVNRLSEPGEPDHGSVSQPDMKSVWWQITPSTSGKLVLHTAGSSFDTVLAAYTGESVATLTPVAANDDHTPIAPASRLSFNVVAGTTYRIAVAGKAGAEGLVKLTWSLIAP